MSFFRRSQPSTPANPPPSSSSPSTNLNTNAPPPADRTDPDTDDGMIDPELRLRTVRTAASTIAESVLVEQRISRRTRLGTRKFFKGRAGGSLKKFGLSPRVTSGFGGSNSSSGATGTGAGTGTGETGQSSLGGATGLPTVISGRRRKVYVNMPLGADEVDSSGEPIVRYARNKVRTTKYTILTFFPKNIYEQFRRVANIYFAVLIVIQFIPLFGATNASISWLPLAFILAVTAIKDAIEDYRRAIVDEELNTSAATKLAAGWKNVNQPTDPRTWVEKMLGLRPPPGKVTRGVRRLREREAREAKVGVGGMGAGAGAGGAGDGGEGEGRIVLRKSRGSVDEGDADDADTMGVGHNGDGFNGGRLERVKEMSFDGVSTYPPSSSATHVYHHADSMSMDADESSTINNSTAALNPKATNPRLRSGSLPRSTRSTVLSTGVLNHTLRTPGTALWERTLWKKLEVGDIVLLRENDQVPADLIVLSTSDPDGLCYVETKNLDGETNLKPRRCLNATSGITSEEDIERAQFVLDSEPPHPNLYLYNGVLRYSTTDASNPTSTQPTPRADAISINEMLLRGCSLRNTSWIIGLVVFTGSETKIMLNGGSTPSKRSKIEKETNFNVIANFVLLFALCVAAAVGSGVYDGFGDTSREVFESSADPTHIPALLGVINFATALILFQNIVPISLYISIEIVKTIQAYFIAQDIDMYYAPYDVTCVPKNLSISDDLGQIEYIFSDKTGTLTQNIMEFQKCSINGVIYGEGVTEAQKGAAKRKATAAGGGATGGGGGVAEMLDPVEQAEKLSMMKEDMIQRMNRAFKNRWLQPSKLTFISPHFVDELTNHHSDQRTRIIAFFRALSVCHSVLADKPEPETEPFRLEYKAESPDEAALVAAARDVGFPCVARTNTTIDIEVLGQRERYSILKLLEFNSTRKRMSVVVRNPEGKIVLYSKGADSVIYARLSASHDPVLKSKTAKDMEEFANSGLRTLAVAFRYLSEEEYFEWSRVYDAANASTSADREEEIDKACEMIEKGLVILGATALEDKLQEGVPEAIETLHQAGIKLWILTGDKLQTAIEIGFSCNLLKPDMDILIITAVDIDETRAKIEAGLNKIASVLGPPVWSPKKRGFFPGSQTSFAVVIDGDTLRYALNDQMKGMFLNLATQCETVVCCRVSPAQKAQTVKLVKEGRDAMTLSIGDGANDVAMIQEANIGCGLFGLEGSQAAMSADYAFGQFRFLTKLLLVHGRWSYMRIADMHANFFYKNVIWTVAMFWFLFFSSFDANYLYDYSFILLYNLLFTSLPVISLGAFDQDLNARAMLAFPQLYVRGIRGLEYTKAKFWSYMADGLYQSAVVFFIPYLAWTLGPALSWNGKGIDSWSDFGTTIAVSAIFSANLYVGLNTRYWTIITWFIVWGSSLVMVIWIAIYSAFDTNYFNDEVVVLYGEVVFWATVIVTVTLCLGPRYLARAISTSFFPLDRDIVREMWVHGDLKDRLGIKHRKELKTTLKETKQEPDIERMPIYHQPHIRTDSDTSSIRQGPAYHPTTISPMGFDVEANAVPMPMNEEYGSNDMGLAPPSMHLSPLSVHNSVASSATAVNSQMSDAAKRGVSPNPSYYSASDIPIPSPQPSPKFSTFSRETPMAAVSPALVGETSRPSHANNNSLSVPRLSPGGNNPGNLDRSNSYEMHVRSQPSSPPPGLAPHPASPPPHPLSPPPPSSFPVNFSSAHDRAASRASEVSHYATASEGGYTEDERDGNSTPTFDRGPDAYYSGPHAM